MTKEEAISYMITKVEEVERERPLISPLMPRSKRKKL